MTSIQQALPEWAKLHAKVVSSVHGTGAISSVRANLIGMHFYSNTRDRHTDCWYEDEAGDGRYTSGHGIDEITPASTQ